MIAVCDESGRWQRRLRDEAVDGPCPYSDAFYQEYLQHYSLPPWFFRPQHLAMLSDGAEARLLGVQTPEDLQAMPSSDLQRLMPATPARPIASAAGRYRLLLCNVFREYLGRRFPAVDVDFDAIAYVSPKGYILMVTNREAEQSPDVPVATPDVSWMTEQVSQDVLASYRIENDVPALPGDSDQRRMARGRLHDAHVADGGVVNPTQIPAGNGRWEFLDSTDQLLAMNSSQTPEAITRARGAGQLSLAWHREDVPSVVFYPERRYFNPDVQPEGRGRWEYFTSGADDSDENIAWLNFGGVHGLPNHPTASQIFRLRQQYRAQPGREDLTEQYRLVWTPGRFLPRDEGADPVLSAPDGDSLFVSDNSSEGEQRREDNNAGDDPGREQSPGVLGPGIDRSQFDPTNGDPRGPHDQTARRFPPQYCTWRIAKDYPIITLDRSRPRFGVEEKHKSWTYTLKGWRQYPRYAEVDWNNENWLTSLARWRRATSKRAGWPDIRQQQRVRYARDERRWLEASVRAQLEINGKCDNFATYDAFKAKFRGRVYRTEDAISSAILRIKRRYKKENREKLSKQGVVEAEVDFDEDFDEELDEESDEESEGEPGDDE